MRHWSQLATRNCWAKRGRTFGAALAIAVGTASVVWITCCYESVRRATLDWAVGYIGNAHITVSSPLGKFDQIPQRMLPRIRDVENVAHATPQLVQRLRADPWRKSDHPTDDISAAHWYEWMPEIDIHGIDLDTEDFVREHKITAGRALNGQDRFACVLEAGFAESENLQPGDKLLIWMPFDDDPHLVEIVGLLYRRRIADFQKPVALMPLAGLQEMTGKFALITTIDIVLTHADEAQIKKTFSRIRAQVRRVDRNATIRSAAARLRQIEAAQSNQQALLVLLSCVAMLTALFIILSTLSMGMIERIGRLGLLRCVGMTRSQVALLVLYEVAGPGFLGTVCGLPLGLGLAALTVLLVPQYVGEFAISSAGLMLAVIAGVVTTLLAALFPAVAALRVSPMEAAHPRANRTGWGTVFFVGLLGLMLLAAQHFGLVSQIRRSVYFVRWAAFSIVILYIAYALLAPMLVCIIGGPAVRLAAYVLKVRRLLLHDQVGQAVWRSAGVCCGLMVGLSLIIAIAVVNGSVTRGWQFPSQFPAAYLWSFDQMRPNPQDVLDDVPGLGTYTAANSVNVIVEERPFIGAELLRSVTWFMGCDPDSFMDLIKLEFEEGNEIEARRLLKQGGYIVVADDFARSRNKHLGDEVRVFYGTTRVISRTFVVAGVVRSPALDIAAGYFQMHSQYNVAASGSVIGTNADLKKLYGIDGSKLILMNFDLPAKPVPQDWPPPRADAASAALADVYYDTALPLERRWRRWREQQVLLEVKKRLRAPQAFYGTVAELKDEIDAKLTRMTRLLTAVPAIALLVAAIGVANLMTANVAARAKQLAMLRAVGATRGLIIRMVLGEALVLGMLGSGLGLLLGLHLAVNITELVERMWGFRVAIEIPWPVVSAGIALTIGLCAIFGILPARHASRTDVVDALHVA